MEAVNEAWEAMSPGDKQASLLDQALDRKREILAMPLPDESDDSAEATRLRALILAAADSTISQTIALRSNMLAMAQDNRDAAVEQFIEERRQKALVMIEKMKAEPAAWPNGRDGHGESMGSRNSRPVSGRRWPVWWRSHGRASDWPDDWEAGSDVLRRVRKQRARDLASKDAAAKRAEPVRARAEREATERARGLDQKRLDAHRREVAGDHAE